MPQFTDLMIDLETYDNKPGSAIMSIGLVLFNRVNDDAETFHTGIQASSTQGTFNPETIMWWLTQPAEARQAVVEAVRVGLPEKTALLSIADFIHDRTKADYLKVWGNGASFDIPILETAFRRQGLPVPWKFYNHRCYRTYKQENKQVLVPKVRGHVAHDALSDAIQQTRHLKAIFAYLSAGAGGGSQS